MSDTLLDTENTSVNKTDKTLALVEITLQRVWGGGGVGVDRNI